jgi:hypothetical protein
MCGVDRTEANGMEECPVSRAQMATEHGLSHLWAFGTHERAMRIWEQDEPIRRRLAVA